MEITFFKVYICLYLGFPGGSAVNNTGAMQEPQETQIRSLGQEDPLEEGTALSSSCLENPWTEEPGGLQSIESQRVRPDCSNLACMHAKVCLLYS